MRMNQKSVSGLLGALLLLSQLTACSSPIVIYDTPLSEALTAEETAPADTAPLTDTAPVTQPPETETDAPIPEADGETLAREALSALRRDDLDGMNILIAAADESAVFGDFFTGENAAGTALPAERAARTRLVEERYNVRILSYAYEKEALFQEIKNANLSDVPYIADFYAIPYDQVGRFHANGLLLNLRTLPFTDFEADYFDHKAMNALSAGHGIWGAVGDYTFSPENAYAIYFNKAMNSALGLPTPYTQVNDGSWTWEVLFENAKAARTSADGDNAVFGDNLAVLGVERCAPMFTDAASLGMTVSGADKTPTFSPDIDRMSAVASLLKAGLTGSGTAPTASDYTDVLPDDAALFINGNMLYYCGTLSHMATWADTAMAWGIVPLPKADAAQRSYSTYVGETAVLCAASTNAALEETGTILQALFAASSHTYPDLYLDEALKYYVRDTATVEMLDLICTSMRYDFTSMFTSGYSNLRYASSYAISSAVTNNYSVKTVCNNYRSAAEKELAAAFPTNR